MKPLFIFYSTILFAIVTLILDQVWFQYVPIVVFWKIFITLTIIGGLMLAIQAVKSEVIEEKKQKDDGYTN
jgi:hypothetical protein